VGIDVARMEDWKNGRLEKSRICGNNSMRLPRHVFNMSRNDKSVYESEELSILSPPPHPSPLPPRGEGSIRK